MLKVMAGHLKDSTPRQEVIEHVEYRNLAPLYCDEELRICVRKKKQLQVGNLYDLWIEGPTGGVAVKATVTTTKFDPSTVSKSEAPKGTHLQGQNGAS